VTVVTLAGPVTTDLESDETKVFKIQNHDCQDHSSGLSGQDSYWMDVARPERNTSLFLKEKTLDCIW